MTAQSLLWLSLAPGLIAALTALFADAFGAPERRSGTVAAALLLAAGGLVGVWGGWGLATATVYGVFRVGAAASTVSGAVYLLAALSLLGSLDSPFGRGGQGAALVALATLGSALVASSVDLLITVIALELTAVSAYALVHSARTPRATEAAMKYFVQGAVATGILFLSVAVLGGASAGRMGYAALAELLGSVDASVAVVSALLLVLAGLAFKLGAVPLHSWAPDAYENAPAPASAVLAGPGKLAAGVALATFAALVVPSGATVFARGSALGDIVPVLALLGGLSIVIGSLGALAQASYARMLGYAGVAQAGFALIAVASLNPSAAVVHLTFYAIASTGVFVAAAAFRRLDPEWDGSIAGLAGIARTSPVLAAAVTVCLASLAGLPPLAGFWGKFQAFGAAINAASATGRADQTAASWMFVALAAAGVLGAIVSVAYYGAVVRAMYFDTRSDGLAERTGAAPARWAVIAVVLTAAAVLVLGSAPALLGLASAVKVFTLIP